jgi:hypothetical protein
MTEAELQSAVIETARLFHWRVAHFRPALTAKGWRTPVEGDGAGFPDLVLVRRPVTRRARLIFAELKSATGNLSVEQQQWLAVLEPVAETFLWRPAHWTSGAIEEVLRAD